MALSLHPPPSDLQAVVVIPARNEEQLIVPCLRALKAQRGLEAVTWEVILVLDDCRDQTAARARATWGAEQHRLHELPVQLHGAENARACGMLAACERLMPTAGPDGLIATTDADTEVGGEWLWRQLEATAAGASVIGGRILISTATGASARALARRERDHATKLPDAASDGPADHPFFGGASIGITAGAYREVGGMEPLAALEDEAFARRVRAHGLDIHRLDAVTVRTSSRTDGRATRGLARDLKLHDWSFRRTWEVDDFDPDELLQSKHRPVSVILPAKGVAETIGPIVTAVRSLQAKQLVDELLVVHAHSDDRTAAAAAAAGATVLDEASLQPEAGACRGKGDAMWRAAAHATGEILVFCDADTTDFDASFVVGLLGPLLVDSGVQLVKGAFKRPRQAGSQVIPDEGGRVTELVARPLLNMHFFELAGLEQPLAGEIAIERSLFERLSVPVGYGVEIAMLIDAMRLAGIDAIGQTQLGTRQNRHQPLRSLSAMAYEVMVAAHRRLDGAPGLVAGPLVHPETGARSMPACEERPPLRELKERRSTGLAPTVGCGAPAHLQDETAT